MSSVCFTKQEKKLVRKTFKKFYLKEVHGKELYNLLYFHRDEVEFVQQDIQYYLTIGLGETLECVNRKSKLYVLIPKTGLGKALYEK